MVPWGKGEEGIIVARKKDQNEDVSKNGRRVKRINEVNVIFWIVNKIACLI